MKSALMVIALVACAALPHVEPAPRSEPQAWLTTVRVDSTCSAVWGYSRPSEHYYEPPEEFRPPITGTGVIISEQHVITAAHVVGCPNTPDVRVTLGDGRSFRMWVDRDDAIFGDGTDLARLVMTSGSKFELGIAPPQLGNSDGSHYMVATRHGVITGERNEIRTRPGDSGSGVYAPDGALVGLLLGTDETGGLRIARVDETWLKGT